MPVLISGAPRSGASVIAEALASSGVFLGSCFGNADNESSMDHLCDQDVVTFHTGLLEAGGASWLNASTLSGFEEPQIDLTPLVSDLVHKFQSHPLWGWKDPRALFFLDTWSRFLPDAKWLFVVRRPAEIAWATAAGNVDWNSSRWSMVRKSLDLWVAYNERLLRFVKQNPERRHVILMPDDLDQALEGLQTHLPEEWGETTMRATRPDIFNSYLMRADVPRWVQFQADTHPSVRRLWRELQSHRTVPGQASFRRERPAPAHGGSNLAVISQSRRAYSQTFVQAHIQGLQARVDWLLVDKPREGRQGLARTNDEIPLHTLSERVRQATTEALGIRTNRYVFKSIKRYLSRHNIEAVLAEFGPVAVQVMEPCNAADVPLVAHFHGYDASRSSTLAANREQYQRLFKIAAALVVVSRDMEKQLAALGAPPEKIHYNPCSVDMDEFQGADPGNAAPTFMATGRYVNKKGPHLTLLAFATVVAACPDARLIMVGDGYLRPACEDLVRALGIEKAVQFIGFLPHTSVATLMRDIRGFVQHSIEAFDGDSEGTPVAIMEAAATGLPILATSHAGIKEVVKHGETGFLVEPGDIDSMAEHWIDLARDPALAGRMGMAGRGHIGNSPFERSRSLANLLRIVESVISKTGA